MQLQLNFSLLSSGQIWPGYPGPSSVVAGREGGRWLGVVRNVGMIYTGVS